MKSVILSVACILGVFGYAGATGCNNVVERVEFVTDYVPVERVLFLNHENFNNQNVKFQRNFVRVVRDRDVVVERVVQKNVVVRQRGQLFGRLRAAAQALTQRNVQRNVEVRVETVRVRNIKGH